MSVLRINDRKPAWLRFLRRCPDFHRAMVRAACCVAVLFALFAPTNGAKSQPALSEDQVKALFLYNLSKYVEWPEASFSDVHSPIVIGVAGGNELGNRLEESVRGKNVHGRPVRIQAVRDGQDIDRCHVLFIVVSEKARFKEILASVKARPILTVSELPQSSPQGVVVNIIHRDGKLRFIVDLAVARQAGLDISSKLLNLADKVYGKE